MLIFGKRALLWVTKEDNDEEEKEKKNNKT